ncbi:DNA polymerase subunit Cdc27 [Lasallia pustulata]|uniref:DNA polymerase delta subunit 3 n=1 Tax=Lasallia pustulata TaxID=136370 RepID=A0A1W5CTK9_9LECA|nr:DNA polymerase subunit Cdc27 [Lasallia pustulata]
MAPDYTTYLAENVLNEGNIVTYRSLSRALKVHSSVAKHMLYDFHDEQTRRKPGSIHATYLIGGARRVTEPPGTNGVQKVNDQDVHMPSSPYMSSSMPHQDGEEEEQTVRSITLVKEEQLEEVKSQYATVHSVHVYSLEQSTIQNLQLLSDCTRAVSVTSADEDPLVAGKQYGVIQNTRVKRRTGGRPPVTAPTIATTKPAAKSAPQTQQASKPSTRIEKPASQASRDGKEASPAESGSDIKSQKPARTNKKATGKPTGLKREQSDLFKSFSKPRAKLNREDTASSVGDSPAPSAAQSPGESTVPEDEPMEDASEDEQEADFLDPAAAEASSSHRKSQAERSEQRRKMMEQEDEPMPNAPPSEPDDANPPAAPHPDEPTVVISSGRRRGRRKVLKKKTTKDAEGYLVTREEPAWESFSEDEPAPAQKVAKAAAAGSSVGKAKKAGGKPGQGNIMSFFGKK